MLKQAKVMGSWLLPQLLGILLMFSTVFAVQMSATWDFDKEAESKITGFQISQESALSKKIVYENTDPSSRKAKFEVTLDPGTNEFVAIPYKEIDSFSGERHTGEPSVPSTIFIPTVNKFEVKLDGH